MDVCVEQEKGNKDTQEKEDIEETNTRQETLRKAERLLAKAVNIDARTSEMMQKWDELYKQ